MAKAKKETLAKTKIPSGFKQVAVGGGFSAFHDFHKQPILVGTCKTITLVKGKGKGKDKKKDRRYMEIVTPKGVAVTVGESHALQELFDAKPTGKQVFIQFLGQDKFKKDGETHKVNKFAAAIK